MCNPKRLKNLVSSDKYASGTTVKTSGTGVTDKRGRALKKIFFFLLWFVPKYLGIAEN